jgi:lipopolysaccharide export system permease protein
MFIINEKIIFRKFLAENTYSFLLAAFSMSFIVWVIQAVNFLDIISEDGHAFKVYFLYTIFNLPKIISKILPFIFLVSLIHVLIRYEINNELIIFWLLGISKIKFINTIMKLSLLYFLFQVLLSSVLVPYSLDKARSFFRTSNLDLFTSIIKEKKFIDIFEKYLTTDDSIETKIKIEINLKKILIMLDLQ